MIEEEEVECPVCENKLNVKVLRQGKKSTYIVPDYCINCKTPANKLENILNRSNKRGYIKTERSYIKLDPRG